MSITKEEFESIAIGDEITLNGKCDIYSGRDCIVSSIEVFGGVRRRIETYDTPGRAWPRDYIMRWTPRDNFVNYCAHEGTALLDLFGGSNG